MICLILLTAVVAVTATNAQTIPNTCADKHVGECDAFNKTLPNFCSTAIAGEQCPRFCEHCQTALTCYNCPEISDPMLCNITTKCDNLDQFCIVAETVTQDFEQAYRMGCSDKSHCSNVEEPIFGRRKRYPQHVCCHKDLCNDHTQVRTTSAPVTTMAATTPSATSSPTSSCSVTMNGRCPNGFITLPHSHLNSCYYFGKTKVTWEVAKNYCERLCSHLGRIDDDNEEHQLSEYIHKHEHDLALPHHDQYYWLDGHRDQNDRSRWIWNSTGKPITYFNWHQGTPDDIMGREDCLDYGPGEHEDKGHNYYWNDRWCGHDMLALCEFETSH